MKSLYAVRVGQLNICLRASCFIVTRSLKGISPQDRERDHVPCRSSSALSMFLMSQSQCCHATTLYGTFVLQ
jgi:hypothetical protein